MRGIKVFGRFNDLTIDIEQHTKEIGLLCEYLHAMQRFNRKKIVCPGCGGRGRHLRPMDKS